MDIVLVNPQIPPNTGSIARSCAATQTPLHLIEPLGFNITEKAVRRAGLDYWSFVPLTVHPSWDAYVASQKPENIWLFSTHGTRLYYQAPFGPRDALVFGSETTGLGDAFISMFPIEQVLKVPIACSGVRSLNLSNTANIALFEARRQLRLDE